MKKLALFIFAAVVSCATFAQDTTKVASDTLKPKPAKPKKILTQAPVETTRTGSQVLDDSTKNVYGPATTLWTTERDIFTGQSNYRTLDSTINNFHRWTYVQRLNFMYHDLGNNGTALNPFFPQLPGSIGVSPGFNVYGHYFHDTDLKLYDTKSPYTRMYAVWGGEGRASTGAEYSRNINPRWNVSANYRSVLSDKQILRQGKGDRHAINHYYDLYTHYATPKEQYRLVFSFRRIRHRVNENGGLTFIPTATSATTKDSTYASYFGPRVTTVLRAATSIEQRNEMHFFHQFALGKFQPYHILDYKKQINWFKDDPATEVNIFFDPLLIDSPAGRFVDSTRFSFLQNQFGLKGSIGTRNQLFFNGYYKVKSYKMFYKYLEDTVALHLNAYEHSFGGEAQYAFDSVQHVALLNEVLRGGYLRSEARISSKWFDGEARRLISKPTYVQNAYAGHFDLWNNDFRRVTSTSLSAFPKFRAGPISMSAGFNYTAFDNYIYFARRDTFPGTDQTVLPLQTAQPVSFVSPQARMDLAVFRKIHLRPQVIYARILQDKDSVLRVPKILFNCQIAYENDLFRGNLQVQVGFDVQWHSAYKAMGYDPAIQTFFNQDTVTPPTYVMADFFFNGKMKRGRFFFRYHNIRQAVTQIGQMPTPYYREMKNILDFGFDILLFD